MFWDDMMDVFYGFFFFTSFMVDVLHGFFEMSTLSGMKFYVMIQFIMV